MSLAGHGQQDDKPRVLGGEGVGLVRTEFGYITRSTLPTEEELYEEYAELTAAQAGSDVSG